MYNSNITPAAVQEQNQNQQPKSQRQQGDYNQNSYFGAYLKQEEAGPRYINIRLLPITAMAQTPFMMVKVHNVATKNKKIKTYICPKNHDPNAKCPFCEIANNAYAKKRELEVLAKANPTDYNIKQQIETYGKIGYNNLAKTSYIVRLIERGKENEGVKFWMFSASSKGKGIYDSIMNLFETAYRRDNTDNIFDLNTGHDIEIELKRLPDGSQVKNFNIIPNRTSLTANEEMGMSWINDARTWDKMWTVKPYEYLEILAAGGEPIFDKSQNKYVDRTTMQTVAFSSYANAQQPDAQQMYGIPQNPAAPQQFGYQQQGSYGMQQQPQSFNDVMAEFSGQIDNMPY